MLKLGKFKDGTLLRVNENKPSYASILIVDGEKSIILNKGFFNESGPRLAFIAGRKDQLEAFISDKEAGSTLFEGKGQIVTIESTEWAPGFVPKVNPSTAEELEERKVMEDNEGKVIFTKNEVDLSEERSDSLIKGKTSDSTTYAEAVEASKAANSSNVEETANMQ